MKMRQQRRRRANTGWWNMWGGRISDECRAMIQAMQAEADYVRQVVRRDWFRLEGRELIRCEPHEASFGVHIEGGDTTIAGVHISTVCLGLDHGFYGPPQVFETMAFVDGRESVAMQRYATYDEAEAGHATACANLREHFQLHELVAATATPDNLLN